METEVGAGNFGNISAGGYNQSFGAMPSETCYHNPLLGVDLKSAFNRAALLGLQARFKALSSTSGGAGTAGNALIPVYVDPRIVDVSRKYTPLVEMIPRVTNMGKTADYNKITSKGAGVALQEDGPGADATDVEARASTAIKWIYAFGRVTGQAQAAMPSYILEGFQAAGSGLAGSVFSPQSAPNAKQYEVIKRARALREFEENLIVNGSTSSDANEFDGIVALQSTTNQLDLNSANLKYDDIETVVDYAFTDSGRPNLAVAASTMLKDLRKIMIDTYHYRPSDMTTKLPFGVSSHITLETMVGPVPVIPSQNLSTTSGAKQLFFLDMNYWEMRVLQDMTYEDLAKTNDSQKFMLKIYEALICKNTAFNAFIDNAA